jgi:phosphatidylserine/phosphatidylglycerophosphate/cardiolipin synthase-like enzyme
VARFQASIVLVLFLPLILLLGGCKPTAPLWLDPLPSLTPAGFSSANQLFSVYFSSPTTGDFEGGPDRELAQAIDNARNRIDGALYDLNLWTIRNALIRAHERGVEVRLVVESDSLDRSEIQELITAGIPVVSDDGEGLMHNKFLIIDDADVWTGSMNLTVNGAYRHLNDLIQVRSTLVAHNYRTEFEEMFLEGYFGEVVLENTPHPILTIDGVQIESYFSPDDSVQERIIELIQEARENVDFCYYSFTSDPIADALLERADNGITLRGVVDTYQEGTGIGGEYQRLKDLGIDIHLDGHPEKMHLKLMIIDRRIVITGSYNLTRSAETRNDENTLVIHSEEIASYYLKEFDLIFADAQP